MHIADHDVGLFSGDDIDCFGDVVGFSDDIEMVVQTGSDTGTNEGMVIN